MTSTKAEKGTLEMVKIEQENGGIIDSPTEKESLKYPLIAAAKSGSSNKIREFLEKEQKDIWEKDEGGRTALHHAAGHANGVQALDCVKTLLFHLNADSEDRKRFVNCLDRQQRFPLSWAASKGNVEVVEFLLSNGADPTKKDKNYESALHAAATNSHSQEKTALECVKRILESEICNDEEILQQLLNLQSTEDNLQRTALHLAVVSGNEELVQYLLQIGANPLILDRCNYNILHLAIQNGMPEKGVTLTNLILKEVDPSNLKSLTGQIDNWTRAPIHLAARLGNQVILSFLVDANVNLFQIDQNLNTALHLAASLGNEEKAANCVSALLLNNLSEQKNLEFVNFSNNKGQTALYLAAKNLNTEAAKKLLLAGSEFDIRTTRNKSPLEKVYRNVPEALVVLLDEAVDRSGYSARNGMISNYAKIDFGPILGKSEDLTKLYRETGELAKICHARLSQRQPVLSHIFVRIFVWKKWEKVWFIFALSRFFHILWYFLCLVYLMKVYREICPFKSPKNGTVPFSISALSPQEAEEGESQEPMKDLSECDLTGFPKIAGMFIIFGSIFVLLAELHPTYQRFQWCYKPLKNWTSTTICKNFKQIFSFIYNVFPISQILIFLLVLFTSPPLFGLYPFSDVLHFTCIAAFAFTTCFCCYLEVGRIPSCRVYVNLLKKISSSLFFAILVHVPILVGFAAVFVFLLQDMPSFSSLPQAIVKVLTLSIGELDYQNVIYEGRLLFKGIEMIAFGIFVIFITVVLINFLVGLATDDVKESRNRRKEIWKLCTQIEQIMLLESFLDACGSFLGRYILKNYLMLMPPYRPGEQRRQVEIFIPSLPKGMQKELHNLNLKIICQPE